MSVAGEKEERFRRAEEELRRKRLAALNLFKFPTSENTEYALSKIAEVMSDKKFQESLRKQVEASFSTTYDMSLRFLTLARTVALLDEEELIRLINDSIPDVMRVGLDFTFRGSELYREFASKIIDVLERTAKTCEEKEGSQERKANSGGRERHVAEGKS